ncbi:family 1 putative glycosyltransferase [Podospora fimiseda]|uniref:Sterol 3-beta-glucosyltransferase n=1 Tax=Podospora fimiseda TaxID=252190 RepID=A0AAN7BLY4_9PEZI|nr:family 1 putative glycosyltransferase [Podospora fimiseda]
MAPVQPSSPAALAVGAGPSKSQHPPISSPNATSHEDQTARRAARKLQKKRRDGEHTPRMDLPECLRKRDNDGDSDEEVLRPQGYDGGMFMNMNQSVFGLITAAASQTDFTDRFEVHSSDEDEDDGETSHMAMTIAGPRGLHPKPSEALNPHLAQTTTLRKHVSSQDKVEGRHRRKFSENRLLRSVPGLSRLSVKVGKSSKSSRPQPQPEENEAAPDEDDNDLSPPPSELAPSIEITRTESRTAPVMSRMLEARAEMASRPSFDLERPSGEHSRDADSSDSGPSELAKRLKAIFEFDTAEDVIEEYPCWLLQNVLVQGYMYITTRHIAFYAYLPKKAHEVVKSGHLAKCGKRNPKYNRYWFRLKGDVLSYYRDSNNLYFPSGHVDLRYGISTSITESDKDGVNFTLTTHTRTYYFRADSPQSAKEWVKCLQRVIFRSHNDGDSVKISLPVENVIDVEETQMLGFADTCKIRVIDSDETYAIDEYFFSFFSYGKEAINILKILVEDANSQTPGRMDPFDPASEAQSSKRTSFSGSRDQALKPPASLTGKGTEPIKSTLSPVSPIHRSPSPRPSGESPRRSFDAMRPFRRCSMDASQTMMHPHSPRRSFSDSRRSFSKSRMTESQAEQERHEGSDSYVQSLEDPSQASLSALMASEITEDPSASQILRGSDVFHRPTIQQSESPRRGQGSQGLASPARVGPSRPVRIFPGQPTNQHPQITDGAPVTPTLQSIAAMGSFPFKKANAWMGFLDQQSRRMSNLLATESMGYVEKVSGMWKGGKKHYNEPVGLRAEDEETEDDPEEQANSEARFRAHFALPESEKLQATYFGYILRVLPLYGKIYIGNRYMCFRSLLPGTRTKVVLPFKDIENVDKQTGFRLGYSGLVVVIRGHEEIFFEFNKAELRDDCAVMVHQKLESVRFMRGDSTILDQEDGEDAQTAAAERDALKEARAEEFPDHEVSLPHETSCIPDAPTILFDDPKASFLNFKPKKSLKVTCLTIGSRGDVQPYIALCKKLIEEGHRPRIATHMEFKSWIEGHGIEFAPVGGDPAELMRLCIQNGTFTWAFLREANATMRGWLDGLLISAWEACQESDLLIESPSAMAGIHIAEALGIPYFRAFTMPWTRTRAYPHAFIMPGQKRGGSYNMFTYVVFDNVFWKATAHQINKWRNKTLGLPSTTLEKLQVNKVPFLYNFSTYVVPPPLDYSDWIRVTGYWFLDEGQDSKWTPPKELTDFIAKAREDGKPLVYVGFGSIIVPDPAKMTQEVIDAVEKADVRCILSKGWSERKAEGEKEAAGSGGQEPKFPDSIFLIQSAPHDWLFKQIDAAAHHGGSGTTGASLRAGIPTIIRPFFGDQFFFGSRVEDLGVGICLKKWGSGSFGRALWDATHDHRMISRAKVLGEQIRKENGVDTAVQSIYRDLEYATNLIRAKAGKNRPRQRCSLTGVTTETLSPADDDSLDNDEEESWTFVGGDAETSDEADGGLMKTIADLRDLNVAASEEYQNGLGSKVMGGAAGAGGAMSAAGVS